ncbi:probable ATP-dependent RNA helicase DDX27 [Paramacrobiotus metropolitanus]|uniref:probable ATP-dependent RNA helicase DDX27 n=1 Tax=Paramacrobiotus metropolitanus TaxID=2943436 RepID=UPI0024461160|nr:probable ATP-dependent RNA helicase DDX27 [Paramacrobiotus metropolitanus]
MKKTASKTITGKKRKYSMKSKSTGLVQSSDPKMDVSIPIDQEDIAREAEKEEEVDDAFDEGFELFADGDDYLKDTWDTSRNRQSSKRKAEKASRDDENANDRLKTKQQRKVKAKETKPADEDLQEPNHVPEGTQTDFTSSTIAFHEMSLSRPILKAISDMNFSSPTPIQASAIPVALLGRDLCACSRTGTGKTAAYMLPILERLHYKPRADVATRVLVLVPTRELGAQVYSVTKDLIKYFPDYIQVALAVGGLDMKKQEKELREKPDIVIATPGRLLDHLQNTPSFGLQQVEILVLDEADRMLDEYFAEQMGEIIKMCAATRQSMLFSATLTEEVEKLAAVSLNDPVRLFVDESASVAAALRQEFVRVREENTREALVLALLCRNFTERTLVFIPTKVQVHRFYLILKLFKMKAAELHGNLSQMQRLAALEEFKESRVDILLATDVAARGLDIPFVKTVINLSLPKTLEQYIHRVGRTARAGRVGRSVSLVGENERKLLKIIVKNARLPVQNRIIPPEVISSYVSKLQAMEKDIEELMKTEKAEKTLAQVASDINKAERQLSGQTVDDKPGRKAAIPGFHKGKSRKWRKGSEPAKKDKKKSLKMPSDPEDKSLSKVQKAQAHKFKKDFKPKRTRACVDVPNFGKPKPSTGSKKKKGGNKGSTFAADLTDTRKKGVKRLLKAGGGRPRDRKGKTRKGKGKR